MVAEGYKRTEVGEIPEDWNVRSLGDLLLCSPTYGINAAAIPYDPRYPTYLRITDISEDGRFINESKASVNHQFSSNYILREGDIVLARTGASVGKSYLYAPENGELIFAGFLIRVQADTKKLEPKYLKYFTHSGPYWNWVKVNSMRSGQPGVNGQEYASLLIPIPPTIAEQQAISTALSDTDELLNSLQKLISKKEAIKTATMQELLTGEKRLDGFSGEWSHTRLGDVCEMSSGGTPSSKILEYYNGAIRWISITDMTVAGKFIDKTEKNITQKGLENSSARIFPANTLMLAMYASIGKCCIATKEASTSQAILGITTGKKIYLEYLYYYFVFNRKNLMSQGQQGTQSNLNKGIVGNITITLPSLAEQIAIATTLSDMDSDIDALKSKLSKIKAIKEGMMQELLTGKTRLVA